MLHTKKRKSHFGGCQLTFCGMSKEREGTVKLVHSAGGSRGGGRRSAAEKLS